MEVISENRLSSSENVDLAKFTYVWRVIMNHGQENIFRVTKVAVILNHPINNMSVLWLHVPGQSYKFIKIDRSIKNGGFAFYGEPNWNINSYYVINYAHLTVHFLIHKAGGYD